MTAAAPTRGTLTWRAGGRAEGHWIVTGDPDMMIRLKRILPRVDTLVGGAFAVACTDEVCRDLDWALQRWPLEMSRADKRRLRGHARRHLEREQTIHQVLAGTGAAPAFTPGRVSAAVPLYAYQEAGRDLVHATGGTLVVDDLGLGKTALGLSIAELPHARPLLAITLTALPDQWAREAGKFYPDLKVVPITAKTKLPEAGERIPPADIYVSSYSMLVKWQHHLAGQMGSVVFDEVQELRRIDSQKARAARTIADGASFRVGLTATPLYNHGGELFNILDVVAPGTLGTRSEFLREWTNDSKRLWFNEADQKVDIANPDALRSHLQSQGVLLRRTREDVGVELPPIDPVQQYVPSDADLLERLTGDAVEMAQLILRQDTAREERWRAAGELDYRMRQATGIAKAPFVADFTRLLLEDTERVVLFGWHRAVYDLWQDRLGDFDPVLYTGSESVAGKQRAVKQFLSGNSRVLMMSLKSGAGLDGLQKSTNTVVFGELDWSPGVHRQCIGRVGRPGQEKPVSAYFCVTDTGSDPAMIDVLNIKTMKVDALVDGTQRRPAADAALAASRAADRIKTLATSVVAQRQGLGAA